MVSISSTVRQYIYRNPTIKDALMMGIVNYSSLARKIMNEMKINNFEAVETALKRIPKIEKDSVDIKKALKNSKIETITGVSYIVLKSSSENIKKAASLLSSIVKDYNQYRIIQGIQGTVVVIDDHEFEKIVSNFQRGEIIEKKRGLGEIIITSREDTTFIKGYVAYVSNVLAVNDINLLQLVSFYTDITVIIDTKDMAKAFNVLMSEIEA
ncbi:MAG: ACT domain-containing protein [Thermoplasmata archaeon]